MAFSSFGSWKTSLRPSGTRLGSVRSYNKQTISQLLRCLPIVLGLSLEDIVAVSKQLTDYS